MAGSATFKGELQLERALAARVLGTLDIAYSGDAGLREAMRKSAALISDSALQRELAALQVFLRHIDTDTGLFFYGVRELEQALSRGAVRTLLVTRDAHTALRRFTCDDGSVYLGVAPDPARARVAVNESLLEWSMANLDDVVLVGTQTAEGSMFSAGFGGIGGVLLYSRTLALDPDLDGTDNEAVDSDSDDSEFV